MALFSALGQTRCTHVACGYKWVIVFSYSMLKTTTTRKTEVVYWQCYLVSFNSIWVKGIRDKVMGIGLLFLFVRWIKTQLQNTKYLAVFKSFPDSDLLCILLLVLLLIISFSQSCYISYPSLSLVTYRILLSVLLHIVSFSQSCYILYPFLSLSYISYPSLSLVTYCSLLSVLLHIISFSQSCYTSYPSLSLVTYCILLSVLLHIVSFCQSCYTSYPSLSLVTHCILLSVLLHIVSFSQSCYILYPFLPSGLLFSVVWRSDL